MEEKIPLRDDVMCQHPLLLLLVLGLGLVFMDPFNIGPVGGHEFRPVRHSVAPYKQVMENWPRDNRSRLRTAKLEFVDEVYGPESLEFDLEGRGPYTGMADGRIVRWMGHNIGWETFALVTTTWSEKLCANGVDSTTSKQGKHEQHCGRPLGLRFNRETGDLYIADAYYGLLVVGPKGGIATPLATHAGGKSILFANDLDIHRNGSIFFTDTSMRYNRMNHHFILLEGEATGRLLRYDPSSKTTHILLMRYWLEGPRTGEVEVFANLPGLPDNIRMNGKGQYWVAMDCCRTSVQEVLSHNPWIKNIYFRLPLKMTMLARFIGMKMFSVISLFNEEGEILEVLEDRRGEVMTLVSEVQEIDGKLWIGTVAHNHIATIPYS
ncbi:protein STRICTOSIDINE SYNTHASE-LIKE 13 [Cinnamomum micranthum f. kanehirae]|uniref:Protein STRICTOSIDINE SYNTHASE-LIKE 13 n=1 Tax=Cinnamomum micranthum f. kanehirae TaxID=337451 RepID=A0A3S3PH44_9MAGN|nr:protein STRICTOSIDINE SYNTHASE-LIKE 13 [Cinnamomum micranthum f. kanehirae]